MYTNRVIDIELLQWKNSEARKPLLIRGARQVGKSSSVRNLAKNFTHFIEINFDKNPEYRTIFENSLSPNSICEQLELITNTPIKDGETLLFFDEIQTSIKAISSLRYFYEERPHLHLIAAGSLLEFAMAEIPSFGVGRVRSMFMYPFSFEEFLMANNELGLLKTVQKANAQTPIFEMAHAKLKSYLKKFLIIGGMPEAVLSYVNNGNLLEVQRVLDDLIIAMEADFPKYKNNIPSSRIREVFSTVVQQVGNKFVYNYPDSSLNNLQIKEVLELLKMAGLIYFTTHSASNGIPLGAELNTKKRKIIPFDTGIFQRIIGLDLGSLLLEDDFSLINKGNIAEVFVGLELLKNTSCYEVGNLFYWQREAKSSQAEVDFVIQKGREIIPIEVKSGTKGAMQSMYKFLKEKQSAYGIRTSLENFGEIEKIKIIPLFAIGQVMK